MLGFYENFPQNIHRVDSFTSSLSRSRLQQRIAQVLLELNCKTFTFEEVGSPSVPECTVIFEFGIADAGNFNFVDDEEAQKVLNAVKREPLKMMDLFCAVRYYKNKTNTTKKTPLKFDYYMLRVSFGKEKSVDLQVFHERGPRYISPEDLAVFWVKKVNEASVRKILKPAETA
jgi:hypothetical protein